MSLKIVIAHTVTIPVEHYGGTERVIWYLGQELAKMGHEVTFLIGRGSKCDFAKVVELDPERPVADQIPSDADIVHFNYEPSEGFGGMTKPYVFTMHGNPSAVAELDENTIFVSASHAARSGSESYVYNGLDWDDYGKVDLKKRRDYFHFLANAAWRVKNVKGAIDVICATKDQRLVVMGGNRLNIKMGFRLTLTPRAQFCGMVGMERKREVMTHSRGLIFPVLWHEPFGLALTESMYFGTPVFGTPYGSLPELITPEVGFLSNSKSELASAIERWTEYSPEICQQYVVDNFNARKMAEDYLAKYEQVLNGANLNAAKPKLITEVPKFLDFLP